MRILLDVDGVVLDNHKFWFELFTRTTGRELTEKMVLRHDLLPLLGQRDFDLAMSLYLATNFYEHVYPVDGACQGVQFLRDLGHQVLFVSAPYNEWDDGARKFRRLKHWGLTNSLDEFVYIKDKTLIKGDLLLDDGPHNVKTFPGIGVVYNRNWNLYMDWSYRAHDWGDFVTKITKMEKDGQYECEV